MTVSNEVGNDDLRYRNRKFSSKNVNPLKSFFTTK